jgi:hypothetical protein
VSAGALLFFFFLPLHVHPIASPHQVSNGCSCVYGKKTHTGPIAAPIHSAPIFFATAFVIFEPQAFGWISVHFKATRAPPSISSL